MRSVVIAVAAFVAANTLAVAADTVATVTLAADAHAAESLASRVETFSAKHLGAPYQLDPLGEGATAAIDRDPLLRFDVFDCQTYVETVIAEARSHNDRQLADELRAIRYRDGKVNFATRNHFPDADWIPNNVARGLMHDISNEVAGVATLKEARTHITRRAWFAAIADNPTQSANAHLRSEPQARAELRRLAAAARDADAQVRYIPKDALLDESLLARIPSGSLVFVVRPRTSMFGRVGSLQSISHMGFAIRSGKRLVYRHASSGRAKAVIDADFANYFRQMSQSKSFDGIAVYALTDARLSR
jgi:Protein of unknown function (DUF1460)